MGGVVRNVPESLRMIFFFLLLSIHWLFVCSLLFETEREKRDD